MRPSITLTILIFLLYSCQDTRQNKLELTDTVNQKTSDTKQFNTVKSLDTNRTIKTALALDTLLNLSLGKMTLVSSGQLSPYTTIKINGCNFDLVTRGSDTIYIATSDKSFQTPEGYNVGTRFSDLTKDIQNALTKEPGWGYYYKLSSGWTLGFCEGSSCTDKYPQNPSKVKWIFKRQ